jgi:hypothetical protein
LLKILHMLPEISSGLVLAIIIGILVLFAFLPVEIAIDDPDDHEEVIEDEAADVHRLAMKKARNANTGAAATSVI